MEAMIIVGVTVLLSRALVGVSLHRFIWTLVSGEPPKHRGPVGPSKIPRSDNRVLSLQTMWSYREDNEQVNRAATYIKRGVDRDRQGTQTSIIATQQARVPFHNCRQIHSLQKCRTRNT
jgi:hypothetical protein